MDDFATRQFSLFDNPAFFESADVEFKSAKGGIPGSLWETYSAFANTDGGTIYLGIAERSTGLDVHGVPHADKVVDDLYATVHSNKVSCNVLPGGGISKMQLGHGSSEWVVRIAVPRATRQQRPVYLNSDPLRQTFRRDHTGDYRCTEDEVRRMFADQTGVSADSRILPDFSFDDLDPVSLRQFRQRAVSVRAEHPWHSEDDLTLLRKLGGWRHERSGSVEGLTVAGLLMFGRHDSLKSQEAFPQFQLDYRERPADETHGRWTDRLSVDGSWEGNLFQFYVRVLPKLAGTLKAPFQLDGQLYRYDESSVGVAVREALVNSIIHADYKGQGGVVIDRFPNRIELSNPGTLLLSHEQLLRGGVSECRNKALQQMFQFMGAGDKAGSGIDTIRKGWRAARFRSPSIAETARPDRVRMDLPLESILPERSVSMLSDRFGARLGQLDPEKLQILVMTLDEGSITNSKLQDVLTVHRADLTTILQELVREGFLERKGLSRWTTYELPPHDPVRERKASDASSDTTSDASSDTTSDATSEDGHPAERGSAPLKMADPELWARLVEIGSYARGNRRSAADLMGVITRLCAVGGWLTRHELSELVGRDGANLRNRTLAAMVADGRLAMLHPARNHPEQAYTLTTPS